MKYKIMKFDANKKYEVKEIEVNKISSCGSKTTKELLLELANKIEQIDHNLNRLSFEFNAFKNEANIKFSNIYYILKRNNLK